MTASPPDITALPVPSDTAPAPTAPAGERAASQHAAAVAAMEHELETFWDTRPELKAVFLAAWQSLASPWALLLAVLTRSLVTVPYRVRYRSSFRPAGAPLNLLVALAGDSGTGKSVLDELAGRVAVFSGFDMPQLETPRSGEAIPAVLGYPQTGKDDDGAKTTGVAFRRPDHACRLNWDEIGKLTAQSRRSGATIVEYLKEGISGSTLGGQTAAGDGLIIPSGSYRLVATLNVQPRRAGALLGSAETEGGLPARIVWARLDYPAFERLSRPGADAWHPHIVDLSNWDSHPGYIDALPEMETAHDEDRRLAIAGKRDPAEGHHVLLRAILACALMNLAGRPQLDSEDWHLAGLIMEHSRATLDHVRQRIADPDPVEADDNLRREEALIVLMTDRRGKGMTWSAAYRLLSPGQREMARGLVEAERLEKWPPPRATVAASP